MNIFQLSSSAIILSSIIGVDPGKLLPSDAYLGPPLNEAYHQSSNFVDSTKIISFLHPFTFINYTSFRKLYTHPVDPSKWVHVPTVNTQATQDEVQTNIKLLAVGGGLTAGAQNGGLFRVGQMSAYPNLVARQMGVKDFHTPLFDENEENGTGFLALKDDDSEFPNFEFVSSNTLSDNIQDHPPIYRSTASASDNLGAPGLCIDGFYSRWSPGMQGTVVNLTTGKSWPKFMPFLWRFSDPKFFEAYNLADLIKSKDFNFFLLEDLHERFLHVLRSRDQVGLSDLIGDLQTGNDAGLKAIQLLLGKGRRGVLFTIPNFRHLAAYNWYTPTYLKDNSSSLQMSVVYPSGAIEVVDPNKSFWLMPTQTVDSCYRNLVSGTLFKKAFHDRDILTADELMLYDLALTRYNDKIKGWAKEYDLALVDVEDIYRRIHNSEYKTEEGILMSGRGRGNFFSYDGIYPSTLGQAIIANEVLQSINDTYKTAYQKINISEYMNTISLKP
jgi:hypothetical protein